MFAGGDIKWVSFLFGKGDVSYLTTHYYTRYQNPNIALNCGAMLREVN
jgi:hypothetical protein